MPLDASAQLHAIAKRCREAGEGEIKLRMTRTLRAEAQPLVEAVRVEARRTLPKRGGLNNEQADQAIRVSVLTGARSAGIRLRTRTRASIQTDKYGYARHPVFGDTAVWRATQTPAAKGWWTGTLLQHGPAVGAAMRRTINRVINEIQAL